MITTVKQLEDEHKSKGRVTELIGNGDTTDVVEAVQSVESGSTGRGCMPSKCEPYVSWVDVASQTCLPRIMQECKVRGLLSPWQLVLEGYSENQSSILRAVANATSLQSSACDAPDDARSALIAQGASQYGKALHLITAQLKDPRSVSIAVHSHLIAALASLYANRMSCYRDELCAAISLSLSAVLRPTLISGDGAGTSPSLVTNRQCMLL